MSTCTTIDPTQIDQKSVHNHLLSAVAPRPICFASTIDNKGNVNLSPFSYFNVFSSNPPILIFSPARSGKDNSQKHTLLNVMEVKEVVINIIHYPLLEQMSLSSAPYEKGINEFVKSGLTQVKSTKIRPPRVGEAPISFECKVNQVISLGDGPGAGNLILAEVVLMHFQDKFLNNAGNLDTTKVDWVARMGESWYARIKKEALFQIPKPTNKKCIGVDQLPQSAQKSTVLTGNDLGQLGKNEHIPAQEDLDQLKNSDLIREMDTSTTGEDKISLFHQLAREELAKENYVTALAIVFLADQS
jgi:flavin reductase (DIM6/NTAB) family NADH-FMN oxidoreductase RutF